MKFQIVEGTYADSVERRVNSLLDEGWEIMSANCTHGRYEIKHTVYMVRQAEPKPLEV